MSRWSRRPAAARSRFWPTSSPTSCATSPGRNPCAGANNPEDPEIIKFEVGGITSGHTTYGHRFLAPGAIEVRRQDDWMAKLEKAKVVVDPARRQEIILAEAKNLAFAQGFELVEDAGLLTE